MIEIILEFLSQGWIGSLIGIIGICLGIVVAIYFYRQSRVGPRLVYQTKAIKIIGKDERAIPDDVRIFFGNTPVERLVKNLIIIWNSGYTTFDGKNIIDTNPLRAEYSQGTSVMRVTTLKATRPENGSRAHVNPTNLNEVIFSFDYLDPNDGAVFEIYHTGEEIIPNMMGTIKGLPKGISDWGIIKTAARKEEPTKIKNPILAILVGLGAIMLLLIIAFIILALIYTIIVTITNGISRGDWSSLIFLLVPALPLYLLYNFWADRKKFPKNLMIDELKY
ncbi:MAG: hypothetical protein WC626_07645 [Methanoregula sp.]